MNNLRHLPLLALIAATTVAQEPAAVTQLEPPHLAIGIDAARTTSLLVRFDRDMDTRLHAVCGGGTSFPNVRNTFWADARTFTVDVVLLPDHVYSLDLACPGSAGFVAKDGTRLLPRPWRFATQGARFAEGEAAAATSRLFAAIQDHYSYRDRLGIDWQEIEQKHREALLGAVDGPSLALRVAEALATAQDPHVSVRWNDCTLPTFSRPVVANFDPRGLQKVFPKQQRIGRIGSHARSADNVGYLNVGSFAREQRAEFDDLLQELRTLLDCKALVLDVRTNSGGDELLAKRLAAFFVQGDKVYAAHRARDPKAPEGFRERDDRSIRGNNEPDQFTRPVAVLMGPLNMSSCEAFLLMMKQAPQAFLVGADSYGSSGNPQPHPLIPGLSVALPSWQALRPDGSMFEGEGINPHIHVAATPEQLAEDDPILQEALLRLRRPR
jgi:hypothetical protein